MAVRIGINGFGRIGRCVVREPVYGLKKTNIYCASDINLKLERKSAGHRNKAGRPYGSYE